MRRQHIVLVASVVGLTALVAGVFFFFDHTRNKVISSEHTQNCPEVIAQAGTAKEMFSLGEDFFGGSRGYDLSCARLAYETALRVDARAHERLWYQLGRIDFLEGKFNGAEYKFKKQTEYFGDTVANVHYMLGLTYAYRARDTGSVDDWIAAEKEFQTYVELDPASPWARTDLSWILFSQGKYDEMKPILELGLSLSPDHPWLLNMYGLALLNTNARAAAHEYFIRALEGAQKLTVEDWGRAYPGNDPASWPIGLKEMRDAIAKNVELTR